MGIGQIAELIANASMISDIDQPVEELRGPAKTEKE